MAKPIKVVWICHFTTSEIQERLGIRHRIAQFAPWIANTLKLFEEQSEVELHIVAPHKYLRNSKEFSSKGVHYHFYSTGIPLWGRHWPSFFRWDVLSGYRGISRKVAGFINRVKPDVIHLQGAENPYYSASILQFCTRYPVIVNLQRMNVDFSYGNTREARMRGKLEREILSSCKYFSIRTETMRKALISFNPQAEPFWVRYAVPLLDMVDSAKEYDIVFFGRISQAKGIEDLLEAAVLVGKSLGRISVYIIGSSESGYRELLCGKYQSPALNIIWKGLLDTQEEVHREAAKARICVLPTYDDIIPGTIVESMMLGLPVVSYAVGSIPELNQERESVLLLTKGDIAGLAGAISKLLTEPEYASQISTNARETISKRVSSSDVFAQHMSCYRQVMADFVPNK